MSTGVKVALGIVAVVGVAYFSLGSLRQARVSGNEASAIGALRAINSAQFTYASSVCRDGFAPSLAKLGAAGAISPDLASDPTEKSGYIVQLQGTGTPQAKGTAAPPTCTDAVPGYRATAVPAEPGASGVRFFWTDQTGRVFQATNAAFTGATPVE